MKVKYIHDKKLGVYVARVVGIPGCMSQGKTKKKAKENVMDAYWAIKKRKPDK